MGRRNTLAVVSIVWAAFAARGMFYCVQQPMWEGYDEWAHFAYIQHIVEHGRLPQRTDTVSKEVRRSLELAPLPFEFRDWKLPHVVHEDYWRLPSGERAALRQRLAAVHPELAREEDGSIRLYEAQQPPLYYLLLSIPYRLVRNADLATRLLWMRLFSLLIASLMIPLSYVAACSVLGTGLPALMIPILIALTPEFMVDVCRTGDDGLAMVFISLLILTGVRLVRRGSGWLVWTQAGLLLGAALLTKAYALAFIPFVVITAVIRLLRMRRVREPCAGLSLALCIAAAMSGWWYAKTWRLTGTISGEQVDAGAAHFTTGQKLAAVTSVHWLDALDQVAVSHIWTGAWSYLGVRSWMYRVVELLAMIAGLGLVLLLARLAHRVMKRRVLGPFGAGVAALTGAYLLMCAALSYDVVVVWLVKGYAATSGWYLYSVMVPECLLVVLGLAALTGRGWLPFAMAGGGLICAGLDLYTVDFVSVPYYTGMTFHHSTGLLGAFHASDLRHLGMGEVVRRIAGSTMIAPAVVSALWIAYLVATLALVVLVFALAGRAAGPQPKLLVVRLRAWVLAVVSGEGRWMPPRRSQLQAWITARSTRLFDRDVAVHGQRG